MTFDFFEGPTQLNLGNPPGFTSFTNNADISTLESPSPGLVESLIGFPTASGVAVTRARAIRCVSFLSAVKMLANDIAKMPLELMSVTGTGDSVHTSKATTNPLYQLLRYAPNDYMTSYQLRWALVFNLITEGNFYAQKITNQAGRLIGLMPLNSWAMWPRWDRKDPKNPVRFFDYQERSQKVTFKNEEIWTCSHLALNGLDGSALIALAKDALALCIASDEVSGRFYANGLNIHGFLTTPPGPDQPTEKQKQDIVDKLKRDYTGSSRAQKFSVLPGGMKYEKMQFTPVESQLLESRKWSAEEIARLIGGAPLVVKLGLGSNTSTYASSAAFLEEYYSTSLLPLVVNIEQSIQRDILPANNTTLYVHHDADVVLRGSPLERAQKDEIEIRSGKVSPNEVRLRDHKDPVDGWDVFFFPANSGVFDPKTQQMFIPAQAASEEDKGAAANPTENGNENPNSNENQPPVPPGTPKKKKTAPPKPPKSSAALPPAPEKETKPDPGAIRLDLIARALADRVLRAETKSGKPVDANFVAEVLNITLEKAQWYTEARSKLTDENAKALLIDLAKGG